MCIAGAWFGGFQALMPLTGYFLGSWLVYGLGAAAAGIPLNLIQSAVAAALYLALQKLVRRTAGKYVK